MAGVAEFISRALKGDFLMRDDAGRNWKLIFTVLGMAVVMITCSHKTDEKVIEIAVLNKAMRSLKAEYVDSATRITRIKMESSVKKSVVKDSLYPSSVPPVKIIVKKE